MATAMQSSKCRFCVRSIIVACFKRSCVPDKRRIHYSLNAKGGFLDKPFLTRLHDIDVKHFRLINFYPKKLYSTTSGNLEEDLADLKFLLKSQLSHDKNISENDLEQQMAVLDILLQNRTNQVSAETLREALSSSRPSEMYSLASRIFNLQAKVGDEACMVSTPLFREAALAGDKNAKYSYGQLLFRGAGGLTADPNEAAVMFTELAKEGHPYAQEKGTSQDVDVKNQFTLAGMHYAGYGVEQSFETSYTLYQVAAENGVVQSFNSIGKMYLNGEGVKEDQEKAMEYFMKGAEKGDAQACMSVAHCYSLGKGVETNFDKAFEFHQRAADQGYPPAIYNVGTHYFAGKGVGLDLHKAAELFQKAADHGFSLAEVNLANMYYNGLGVDKDVEKAKDILTKAAPHNHNARLLLEEYELEEQKLKEEQEKGDKNEE